jgi:steroid delta-isomerase-like uncharacterized protein
VNRSGLEDEDLPTSDKEEPMSSDQENKSTHRRFVDEVQSQGRLELVDDFISPDFVDRTPFPGADTSREGARQIFAMLRAAFPDHDAIVLDMIAEGDRVMTYKTFNGTHQGEFMGIPATGRPVSITVMDIVRYENGKIAEHWNVVDVAGLLQQLGAFPAS